MWAGPAAKTYKFDIESHVNARFVVPGNMGFPCRPLGGGEGGPGFQADLHGNSMSEQMFPVRFT